MKAFFAFLSGNRRWLLGGFLLCFCSAFGQTFFIALSGGHIREAYGLSHGEFGSLYMIATLGSALTLPSLGRIVDRLSVSGTVALIAPGLAIACLLMSVAQSVWLLGLTIYMLRLFGQGMMIHTAMTAMGRWFTEYRGRAVALATLGLQTGEAILPSIMVALFVTVGWRQGWLLGALFIVAFILPAVFWLMRQERQPEALSQDTGRSVVHQWTREQVLADPLFWLMLIGILAPGFIGTTIFFHQAYLLELRQWPAEAFASAFVMMALMTTTFSQVAGWLIDRFGAVRVLPAFLAPLSLACFTLAAIEQAWGIFIFMGLLGVSYGISSTLFGALWPEVYGTRHLGSVRSVTVAFMVLSSALGPGVTGLLIDAGVPYVKQMVVMGLYCVSVAAVMIWISRQLVRRQSQTQHPALARR
ncbi:MAG: nitrate/nitrite transporter [Burkholderiaceae bacterium]